MAGSIPGASRPISPAMRRSPGRRLSSSPRDSGRPSQSRAAASSGRIPPAAKMPRQPQRASSTGAMKLAAMEPSAIEQVTRVIIAARCRRGAYSEISAVATGTLAPSPSPVSSRQKARL